MEYLSHRTKSRNDDGLDQRRWSRFFYPGRKGTGLTPSVRKSLLVWRPGNRTIFSGGPKLSSISSPSSILLESHDLNSADTQVLDVCLCFNVACTYILIRSMVVTIETTTPKGRARKTSFWSTLDTLIFPLFFESVVFGVMCSRCNPQTNVGKQLLCN